MRRFLGEDKEISKDYRFSVYWNVALGIVSTIFSCFLIYEHYNTKEDENAICDINSKISCTAILSSEWSTLFSVPLAFLGITWNLFHLLFCFQLLNNMETKYNSVWITASFYWSSLGVIFVLYLLLGEFMLGAICPLCTVVHIATIAIFYNSFQISKEIKSKPTLPFIISSLKQWIITIVFVHIVILVFFNLPQRSISSYYSSSSSTTTVSLDSSSNAHIVDLAKCLTEKSVFMYGSPQCSHCQSQKKKFGDAFEHIIFYDCDTSTECRDSKVEGFPTWIKWKGDEEVGRVVGVQEFHELAKFGNCEFRG